MSNALFCDVFEKIRLSEKVKKSCDNAVVNEIVIDRHTKAMCISLAMPKIIDESVLDELRHRLLTELSGITDISFDVSYNVSEFEQTQLLKAYWSNVLYMVKSISPVCHKLLEGAKWYVEGDSLVIPLSNNGLFLFSKKEIGKKIESLINKRIGASLFVTYKKEASKKDSEKQLESKREARKNEIISSAIAALPYSVNETSENNATDQKPQIQTQKKVVQFKGGGGSRKGVKIVSEIKGDTLPLATGFEETEEIVVSGEIFSVETRETRSGRYLITFDISDKTSSITIKLFLKKDDYTEEYINLLKNGNYITVKGKVQYDDFSKELNIMAFELSQGEKPNGRMDNAEEKRVELHLHTQMSAMDAINSAKDYINRAAKWGHKAIAITDHAVVQAFPEAMSAAKKAGIKVIYGVEAYLVDDLGAVVESPRGQTLDDTFVVFDIETTGLHKESDKIIEIGAVKVLNGEIVDKFSTFVKPGHKNVPEVITKLTGITNLMLKDAPNISDVLPKFLEFVGDSVLVAHNASFDVGFVATAADRKLGVNIKNTVLDTVELSRTLFPKLSRHKLNIVCEHLGINLENHHRAIDDANATAQIFIKCIEILKEKGINQLQEINALASNLVDKKKLRQHHAIFLVKNKTGMKNLYEIVSKAHIDYFYKRPRIPKSEMLKLREGLIIGSACEAGELYSAVLEKKPEDYIESIAEFYDYFEIQPLDNNMFLVRDGKVASRNELAEINKKIVALGEKYGKPVVATCDVHFLDAEDEILRRIIKFGEGFKDADTPLPLFFRTTEEMLKEFSYLGEEKAHEVVVTSTNLIADMVEVVKPVPDGTFPPVIEGSDKELEKLTLNRAKELYGDPLPNVVAARLERELNSIIKNGFSVMYIIAQKLVHKSLQDGYLVGSRGSVGSSLVATMSGITEVNPLSPHYFCRNCQYTDFESDLVKSFAGASGCDMPDMACPVCGEMLNKDGHDIPFETFLGFDGDKEPDIDLNFSGEYQLKAHAYTEELFGTGNVFKAGTIGTLADKTAYGYVMKYFEDKGQTMRGAEVNRLKQGLTGIKKTTGQHPGGLIVLPKGHSIYEFCPVQRPANDSTSNVVTTHYDFHSSIEGRLLKLDILGHDVPTIIRMLHDITGVDPTTVNISDKKVLSLYTSMDALEADKTIIDSKTGTLGLPEFGTSFVRQMLLDTQPSTFSELVRISGLSHGTDVWYNNAYDLIKDKVATLKEIIPTRDDIMVYLINKGVEKLASFKIMESVRKGKGLTEEYTQLMREADVPEWYIESCKKIKYMFPKGHAVAYVTMTMRIGYYKINYPLSFYAATFSVKAEDFDYEVMCHGVERAKAEYTRISAMGKEISAKEKSTLTTLELVLEMYARGLSFVPIDLYSADVAKFKVTDEGIMPPLISIAGLGATASQNIAAAREEGIFYTIEEFKERTKVNKNVLELLKSTGILGDMPETMQLSLF